MPNQTQRKSILTVTNHFQMKKFLVRLASVVVVNKISPKVYLDTNVQKNYVINFGNYHSNQTVEVQDFLNFICNWLIKTLRCVVKYVGLGSFYILIEREKPLVPDEITEIGQEVFKWIKATEWSVVDLNLGLLETTKTRIVEEKKYDTAIDFSCPFDWKNF
jgi:hypothetical protein